MAPNKPHPFYSPLDSSLEQIRLLEITTPTPAPSKIRDKWRAVRKRGTDSVLVERHFEPLRKVECRLHTVSLKDKPAFCALSYVWGDPYLTKPIVVEGKSIQVTTNLTNALCYLRSHWALENPDLDPSEFKIWVDAVSINQLDAEERSAQVAIMGRIYSAASQVYAWLGKSDPHVEAAMRIYRCISEHAIEGSASPHELYAWMEQYPFLCRKDVDNNDGITGNHSWDALLRFFKTAYWRRIWIFQELVLANKLTFVHATSSIQYMHLKRGCNMISDLALGASGFYMSIPEWFNNDVWNAIFVDRRYADWQDPISQDREVYRAIRPRSRLEDGIFILTNGSRLCCSDPRDHIYALLSLTRNIELKPDYTKSYQDVLRDFVTLLVEKPQPLVFLLWSGVGFQATTSTLPSWCPNFEFLSMTKGRETAVFDAGNLVPDGFEGSLLEDDEENTGDTGEQLATLSPQSSLLTVSALPTGKRIKVVHSVLSVETRDGAMKGPLLTFILNFCTRPYPTGIHPIHAFMLTALSGDDSVFENRCSSLLHHMGFPNDTQTVEALGVSIHANLEDATAQVFGFPKATENIDKSAIFKAPSLKISWTELVNEFEKRQKYYRFVETDDGFIGLTPRGTVPGDIIRLIQGCITPMVLRRTETGYLNVGPIYVAGIMKEELFRAIDEGVAAGTLEKLAIA